MPSCARSQIKKEQQEQMILMQMLYLFIEKQQFFLTNPLTPTSFYDY